MSYEGLATMRVEVVDGVAWVTIDHPPMNLLDAAMFTDIGQLVPKLEDDDAVRVVVLCSADPDYFVAHADVEMIRTPPPPAEPLTGPGPAVALFDRFRTMPKVTIAMIDGIARGGGSELALSCDLRYASKRSKLGQPEVALGIIPGAGGTQRLARLVGRARALEIVLGCDDVEAEEAAAIGWINRAVGRKKLRPFVEQLATRLATMPPESIRHAKLAVDAAWPPPEPGMAVEGNGLHATLGLPAFALRRRAFLDAGGQTRDGEQDIRPLLDAMAGIGAEEPEDQAPTA